MFRRLFSALLLTTLLLVGREAADAQVPYTTGSGPLEPPRSEISEAERAEIWAAVSANIAMLEAAGHIAAASVESVTFQLPVRAAAHLTDYGYYGLSGFVDHDPAVGALRDYTCGTRTYDLTGYNHQGTDFFTYPFPWLKMDRMEVEVVAAAPGILVFKRDGQYDRQCAMTGALSNAVVIRHADGTLAHYLHMKKGSVTTKPVGAAIAVGEMLGVIGSSGSSTGPHLHFEVRTASNAVIDPYHGACNPAASMWSEQPPYYDSAVIAVHTGSALPIRPSCPQPETPNTKTDFAPGDAVTFVTYYRDLLAGQESVYRVIRPDGTLYRQWTGVGTRAHYAASYAYRTITLDASAPIGTWRFEVAFEGELYQTHFNVGVPSSMTLTYPSGGETLRLGSWTWMFWQAGLGGDVRIDLYADGAFRATIAATTANDGRHFWFVPSDLDPEMGYTIRISSVDNPSVRGESGVFSVGAAPTADFGAMPTQGAAPLTVVFSDTSTGLVASRLWDFGDGVTATVQHPTHLYTNVGAYTVTLAVTGPVGSDVLTRTDAITVVWPPLSAAFSASPLLGTPPLTVTFAEHAAGPPIESWAWAFGDGVTSTLQYPTHAYTQLGAYTVTLTVGAADEADTLVRSQYVRVVAEIRRVYLPLILR